MDKPVLPSPVTLLQRGLSGGRPSQNATCTSQSRQLLCSSILHLHPSTWWKVVLKQKLPYRQCMAQCTSHRITPCIQIDSTEYSIAWDQSPDHTMRKQMRWGSYFLPLHNHCVGVEDRLLSETLHLLTSLHTSWSPPEPGPGTPFLCHSPFAINRGKLTKRKGICSNGTGEKKKKKAKKRTLQWCYQEHEKTHTSLCQFQWILNFRS